MSEPVYPSDEWQAAFMDRLADQIRKWRHSYYNRQSEVDDATFDLWWRNLLAMEARYPHLKRADSPTDEVGSPVR
jgi:DNA ligase (NAD+)